MRCPLPLVLVCFLASCWSNPVGPAQSVLRVRLHDRPPEDPSITAVVVVVDRLGLREKGRGWMELPVRDTPIDLLALTGGVSTLLAQQPIPTGTFTELRLGVGSAYLVRSGAEVPLEVPSGMTSGIK